MATQVLSESETMRRVPGIVFADGVFGRVPRIAGTGLEVSEIVKTYRELARDRARLGESFHWLTPIQLDAALRYATEFPAEIEVRLQRENVGTPEQVWAKYPFMRPSETEAS